MNEEKKVKKIKLDKKTKNQETEIINTIAIDSVKPTTKKKKKMSKSALILIIGLLIIIIPVGVFGGILGISYIQTSTPRQGSRFENDLVNEIGQDDVSSIQSSIEGISGVETTEVSLAQGQLKVFIDVKDTATEEEVDAVLEKAYSIVVAKLPVSKYFTKSDGNKNYDLHIHVYTTDVASAVGEVSSRQYKILHKNAAEEDFAIDDVAHPKDEETAKSVREESEE